MPRKYLNEKPFNHSHNGYIFFAPRCDFVGGCMLLKPNQGKKRRSEAEAMSAWLMLESQQVTTPFPFIRKT